MSAYYKQTFLVCFAIIVLHDFVSSTYLTWFMDWRCKVSFNNTMLMEDGFGSLYSDCAEEIYKREDGKNHTWIELSDCTLKCYMLRSKMFDESWKPIPSKLTEFYEKYSNVTSDYIDIVTKIMTDCATKAEEEARQSIGNGTEVDECKYFGLYDYCTIDESFKMGYNTTSLDVCGNGTAAIVSSTDDEDIIYDE